MGWRLTLRAYHDHVEVWTKTRCVARHRRQDAPGEPICDLMHFLPVLRQRPGAFPNAGPVRQAHFSVEVQTLLRELEERHRGGLPRVHREFLAICALAGEIEPARWEAACATALARCVISLAGVRAALPGPSCSGRVRGEGHPASGPGGCGGGGR